MVELAIAFVGGSLSLLSPCSALLLPSFFAYAFSSPGRIVRRTMIFYAGLATMLVPLGVGVGALGSIVRENIGPVTAIAGAMLILIGVYQLAVGGFAVPGATGLAARAGGESATATFVTGMVYGIGGFCSGPILAGILTVAAGSGGALTGGVLLAVFALGMVVPLLVLALAWDRIGQRRTRAMRTRSLRIGPFERHWSTVISSLLFVVLGAAFIAFRGANALSGLYESAGAGDLVFRLEEWVRVNGAAIAAVVFTLAAAGAAWWVRARWRSARPDEPEASVPERVG